MNKTIIIGVLGAAVLVGGVYWWTNPGDPVLTEADLKTPVVNTAQHGAGAAAPAPDSADDIIVPKLSQIAQSGELAFYESCSACHGQNASGTDQGPPLVHPLYVPGHHGDNAIASAAINGVQAHHWRFGNMPPVEGLSDAKLRWITKYIREIQVANGIK